MTISGILHERSSGLEPVDCDTNFTNSLGSTSRWPLTHAAMTPPICSARCDTRSQYSPVTLPSAIFHRLPSSRVLRLCPICNNVLLKLYHLCSSSSTFLGLVLRLSIFTFRIFEAESSAAKVRDRIIARGDLITCGMFSVCYICNILLLKLSLFFLQHILQNRELLWLAQKRCLVQSGSVYSMMYVRTYMVAVSLQLGSPCSYRCRAEVNGSINQV